MKRVYEVPASKRLWPWIAAAVVAVAVWQALLHLAHTSGAFAVYVGAIAGLNAYAFVAAGIARPPDEEDDGFVLKP